MEIKEELGRMKETLTEIAVDENFIKVRIFLNDFVNFINFLCSNYSNRNFLESGKGCRKSYYEGKYLPFKRRNPRCHRSVPKREPPGILSKLHRSPMDFILQFELSNTCKSI